MSTATLIRGDCLKVLPTLDAGGIDAVVTDPPYGVGLQAKRAKQRSGITISRPGSYGFDDTPEYVRDVAVPAIEASRGLAKVVVLTPGTRNLWLYPQPDELGCFYSAAATGIGRWGFNCSQPILYYGKDPHLPDGAKPNSCGQTYPNDANTYDHPCVKPIRMALWLIERATLPGWTVLDPFMGVGTFGVAALRLGRNFIGIEIDEAYFAVARKRIDAELVRHPLFEAPRPVQVEMFAEAAS